MMSGNVDILAYTARSSRSYRSVSRRRACICEMQFATADFRFCANVEQADERWQRNRQACDAEERVFERLTRRYEDMVVLKAELKVSAM